MTRNGEHRDDDTSGDLDVPAADAEQVMGGVIAIIKPAATPGPHDLPYPEQSSRLGAITR